METLAVPFGAIKTHFTNHCAAAQPLFTSHYRSYTRHR